MEEPIMNTHTECKKHKSTSKEGLPPLLYEKTSALLLPLL